MSLLKVLGAALATTVLVSTYAHALSIPNSDRSEHTVFIQRGDNESEYAIPAGGSLDEACDESCVVRLSGVEGTQAAQNADNFVIQNGSLQLQSEQ
jgi:hypothetical protein